MRWYVWYRKRSNISRGKIIAYTIYTTDNIEHDLWPVLETTNYKNDNDYLLKIN